MAFFTMREYFLRFVSQNKMLQKLFHVRPLVIKTKRSNQNSYENFQMTPQSHQIREILDDSLKYIIKS